MPNSDNKRLVIRKSNELISARYKLRLSEQRLICLLASEISPDDKDFKQYQITVADFAKMFGLETDKSIYEKVEQAAESLLSQVIRLQDSEIQELTTWLSYVKYAKGSGVIHLEFHSSLKPYLLQLKKHFTQYHLNYVIDFTSQYSIRFYELLKMDAFKAKNGRFEQYFEIENLRLILGLEQTDYQDFKDFRKRTIEPAVQEINEKTDLHIEEVKYGKTGRKITNVTFTVIVLSKDDALKKQDQAEQRETTASGNHPIIDTLIELGFSAEIAKTYKNKHGVKKIERNIAYTLAKKQEGVVKDVPAYLNKAIEADLGGAWDTKRTKDTEKNRQLNVKTQAKQAAEEKARQEINAVYKKAFAVFQSLSEAQQESLKNEFLETTDFLTTATEARKALNKGKNMLTSPFIAASFKKFLVEQKGF